MRNFKVIAAIITVVALGGLLALFFGVWGGKRGYGPAEYQNQQY